MHRVNLSERLSFASLAILVILLACFFSGCATLRSPPKVTKCLTDFKRRGMDCINSQGTEFFISFKEKDIDKHVCMPGAQFIDAAQWLHELIVIMTKGK